MSATENVALRSIHVPSFLNNAADRDCVIRCEIGGEVIRVSIIAGDIPVLRVKAAIEHHLGEFVRIMRGDSWTRNGWSATYQLTVMDEACRGTGTGDFRSEYVTVFGDGLINCSEAPSVADRGREMTITVRGRVFATLPGGSFAMKGAA